MVWHIFKKDWKLLSRLVLGLAAAQCLYTMLLYKRDHGATDLGRPLLNLLQMIMLLASGILVAAVFTWTPFPASGRTGWCGQSREETYWPPSFSL